MAMTIDAVKQASNAGGYITQAYDKAREEGMKPRAKEDEVKAREVTEREQPREDAVVVDVSRRRTDEVAPPPQEEEILPIEEPVEEDMPVEEVEPQVTTKSADVEA